MKKQKTLADLVFNFQSGYATGMYFIILFFIPIALTAQDSLKKPTMEIYMNISTELGYNFNQSNPDWFDAVRPTQLPSYRNQYGTDGNIFFSIRQTRLGIKTYQRTSLGGLRTHFSFDLFGTGQNAGQTAFHPGYAYAELGRFGVGQTWSPFIDFDMFPNSLDYWGPNGMACFRNIMIYWMPIQGASRMTIALERPGASGDAGVYANRVELNNIKVRLPFPDLTAEYRKATRFGYVELAGVLRTIEWNDIVDTDQYNFSGSAIGWGVNLSSNIRAGLNNLFRLQAVYGEGVENYMNDAPADIGIQTNPGDTLRPLKGVPIPVLGIVAFLDHRWSARYSTSIGYSSVNIKNTDAQVPSAFKNGQYALVNLLHYPVPNIMYGVELQYAHRKNYKDGWSTSGYRIQFSFRYNFAKALL